MKDMVSYNNEKGRSDSTFGGCLRFGSKRGLPVSAVSAFRKQIHGLVFRSAVATESVHMRGLLFLNPVGL